MLLTYYYFGMITVLRNINETWFNEDFFTLYKYEGKTIDIITMYITEFIWIMRLILLDFFVQAKQKGWLWWRSSV